MFEILIALATGFLAGFMLAAWLFGRPARVTSPPDQNTRARFPGRYPGNGWDETDWE